MKAGRVQGATLKNDAELLCVQRLWEVKIQSVDLVSTEATGEQSRAIRGEAAPTEDRPCYISPQRLQFDHQFRSSFAHADTTECTLPVEVRVVVQEFSIRRPVGKANRLRFID